MDKIFIRGLELSACHGVRDFEKAEPQKFIIDADIYCDYYAAFLSDGLENTVNYSAACDLIAEIVKGNTFNLIERLAYECAFALLDENALATRVTLTVNKPQAPVKHRITTVGVTADVYRERAYLSLGSSVGDRKKYLDTAIEKLNSTRGIRVKRVSEYISTAPYGGVAENEFLNCAAEVETYLSPRRLLNEIHRIESECGRVRNKRWEDRTLDIDIVFFGDKVVSEDDLQIPHADYSNREFVLKPLKQIAPDFICPVNKKKIKEI